MKTRFIALTGGILFALISTTSAITRYVNLNSPSPASPYTSWATAATNIQQAIDVAVAGDLILVTNGIYQTGGRIVHGSLMNRIALNKAVTVQSVNGPDVTVIRGYQVPGTIWGNDAVRCAYVTSNAVLSGFTLTTGATRNAGNLINEAFGGGLWCESTNALVTNCVLTNNRAAVGSGGAYRGNLNNCVLVSNAVPVSGGGIGVGAGASESLLTSCTLMGNSGQGGGGAYASTLINCNLLWNTAEDGGGAYGGTLINCTLTSNAATNSGGGIKASALRNCIVYYNTAPSGPNYSGGVFDRCCTTPLPSGFGNINVVPRFVEQAGGNLRLQTNSPCINTGDRRYVNASVDLDGRPRLFGFEVDMGAYEFRGAGMGEFIAWLRGCSLPSDGSADYSDADGDGANNWQEWRADTVPTDAASKFRLLSVREVNFHGSRATEISWDTVATRKYWIERTTNLVTFETISTNLNGVGGPLTIINASPLSGQEYFYRIGVQ